MKTTMILRLVTKQNEELTADFADNFRKMNNGIKDSDRKLMIKSDIKNKLQKS